MLLCVLALFVAQTFGAKAGFYCLCGGKPVPTEVSHCYGPHGENCAGEEAHGGAKDGGGTDRRDHEVVNQDVQMRTAEAAQQIVAPQVLLAVLPMVKILFAGRELPASGSDSVGFGKSPPLGVTVARTVVLLI